MVAVGVIVVTCVCVCMNDAAQTPITLQTIALMSPFDRVQFSSLPTLSPGQCIIDYEGATEYSFASSVSSASRWAYVPKEHAAAVLRNKGMLLGALEISAKRRSRSLRPWRRRRRTRASPSAERRSRPFGAGFLGLGSRRRRRLERERKRAARQSFRQRRRMDRHGLENNGYYDDYYHNDSEDRRGEDSSVENAQLILAQEVKQLREVLDTFQTVVASINKKTLDKQGQNALAAKCDQELLNAQKRVQDAEGSKKELDASVASLKDKLAAERESNKDTNADLLTLQEATSKQTELMKELAAKNLEADEELNLAYEEINNLKRSMDTSKKAAASGATLVKNVQDMLDKLTGADQEAKNAVVSQVKQWLDDLNIGSRDMDKEEEEMGAERAEVAENV